MTRPVFRVIVPALAVILAGAVAIVVRQGKRIRTLEGVVADLEVKNHLPAGLAVRQINIRDVSGRDYRLDYTIPHTKPMVIYVMRPSCSVCRGNAPSINALAREVNAKYDVIGLSLERDGLEDMVARDRIQFPMYTDVPRDIVRAYGLGATPETLVVTTDGKIVRSWIGGYAGALQTAIEQFFSLNLPDFPGMS